MVKLFTSPLFFSSVILSILYAFIFVNRPISKWRSIFKTAPILFLAVLSFTTHLPVFLSLAFLLSAIGDYFLSLDKNRFFIQGLVSFLIGHLFFIVVFGEDVTFIDPPFLYLGLIALYTISLGSYLVKHASKYRIPVIAYIIILSTMAISAMLLPASNFYALFGALIFVISDSLLAIRMFIVKSEKKKRLLSIGVWWTYVIAQYAFFSNYFLR